MRTQITKATQPTPTIGLLSRLPISPWVFRDPLPFFEKLQNGTEPIATMRIGGTKVFYLREPDLIHEMLVTFASDFHKGHALQRAKALFGEGLLTSEGELHRQQRKLIQPVFHHSNLKDIAVIMQEHACRRAESWRPGQTLNLDKETHALTLVIVGESLFGSEVADRTARVSELIETIMETFFLFISPMAPVFEFFGHPKLKRTAKARRELAAVVQGLIEERRSGKRARNDLLTLLFAAQDSETGMGMSDEQLRDEVMTLFLAGHETTASALSWTVYLLTQHPEIAERVANEVRSIGTGSRLPDPSPSVGQEGSSFVGQARSIDGPESEFGLKEESLLSRVIRESLRLYPPAWAIGRSVVNDVRIGETSIPKGAIALACQWAIHRCDRYFPNPA